MRAIESGRNMISVITGGGSSVVNINGEVLFESPLGEDLFQNQKIKIQKKTTVFNQFGDFLLLIPSFILCLVNIRRK